MRRCGSNSFEFGITGNVLKDRAQYRTRTKYDDDGAMGGSRTGFVHLVLFTCRLFWLCFFAALLLFLDLVTKFCQMGVFSLRSPLCFDCQSQMRQSRIALLQHQDFLHKTVSKSHSRNCWTTVPLCHLFKFFLQSPFTLSPFRFFFGQSGCFFGLVFLLVNASAAQPSCVLLPTLALFHRATTSQYCSCTCHMPTSRCFWTFHSHPKRTLGTTSNVIVWVP